MPVEVQDEVVRDDRVAGREEGDQALDEMAFRVRHLALQIERVGREVDLLDGPGVLDRVLVHLEEARIRHRTQRQTKTGIEQARGTADGAHWQASQVSGFSSEHAIAAASVSATAGGGGVQPCVPRGLPSGDDAGLVGASTVALAIRVAGRERR
ncbi:MAG: hypothetical protein K0S65_4671 [Labilithrix sp.]|nr:hypothetical protein [Labilithrix sp.]